MSKRGSAFEADERATKSARYGGGGGGDGSISDRWTPGGGGQAAHAAPSSSRPAPSTSGYIHPDRLAPSSNSASHSAGHSNGHSSHSQAPYQSHSHNQSSYNPHNRPPPASSTSYSLSAASHPGGARPAAPYQQQQSYTARPSYSAQAQQGGGARPPAAAAAPARPSVSFASSVTGGAGGGVVQQSASAAAAAKQAALEAERLAEADFQRRMEARMTELEEEKTEEQLAAERAAKRAAILAKYKVQPEQPLAATLSEEAKQEILDRAVGPQHVAAAVEATPAAPTSDATPAPTAAPAAAAPTTDGAAAATSAATAAVLSTAASRAAAIDAYDMFSDSHLAPEVEAGLEGQRDLAAGGDLDSYDDVEGYYRYRLGDLFEGGRYRVTGFQGSGVFSTVLRVREMIPGTAGGPSTEGRELVVKLIRSNDTMYAAGQKELEFLQLLATNDPENKKHTVRLLAHFMHRNHLCLVFEAMSMDLRKVIAKFGSVGLNLRAVRSYAKQLLVALRHLKKCAILHGDIKPDNILVNDQMNVVKLADFGSAGKLTEACELTPYLVSRFYRAPELMLGLPYDSQVDLWSIGTVLYELYTGKILFSGGDNNGMLKAIQDVKGRFPKRMIQRGQFAHQHFDHECTFEWRKQDKVTHAELRQKVRYEKPTRDLHHLLRTVQEGAKLTAHDANKLKQLADFIHQCLTLDPQQRPQCEVLLQHPFIVEE